MNGVQKTLSRVVAGIALVAFGSVGCSSALAPPGSGTGGSAAGSTGEGGGPATGGFTGTGGVFISGAGGNGAGGVPPAGCATPKSGEVPSEHRASAPACNPSKAPPAPDAGIPSCTTDGDCTADPSSAFRFCVHGTCAFDQCLTDGDCGLTGVCGCSSDYYGGNAEYHPNLCVPANCRLDSDCGPNGYCSPSRGHCGTFQGFYCHTAADTCIDAAADCAGCGNACVYSPAVAAFTCGSSICAG